MSGFLSFDGLEQAPYEGSRGRPMRMTFSKMIRKRERAMISPPRRYRPPRRLPPRVTLRPGYSHMLPDMAPTVPKTAVYTPPDRPRTVELLSARGRPASFRRPSLFPMVFPFLSLPTYRLPERQFGSDGFSAGFLPYFPGMDPRPGVPVDQPSPYPGTKPFQMPIPFMFVVPTGFQFRPAPRLGPPLPPLPEVEDLIEAPSLIDFKIEPSVFRPEPLPIDIKTPIPVATPVKAATVRRIVEGPFAVSILK